MAGHNQQVGGLSGTSPDGWISNTGGSTSTLTVSGNVNGEFVGTIGTVGANLSGSTDNEALVLASTNTGSVTLSGNGNSYNGGTTISGGALLAADSHDF